MDDTTYDFQEVNDKVLKTLFWRTWVVFLITAHVFIAKDYIFPKSALHIDVMKEANPVKWWLSLKGTDRISEDIIK